MRSALAALLFLLLTPAGYASKWGEADLWTGSNNFLRSGISFLANVSTRCVAGINYSAYKLDKRESVRSFRLPFNAFVGRKAMFTVKPFYYLEDDNGSSAYGARASLSYLYHNASKESSTSLNFSAAFEKQELSEYAGESSDNQAVEFQLEENFYDEFFILFTASSLINPENPSGAQKRYAEISDLISPNAFAFINDTVYDNFGFQFARSLKPDYDSYVYAGADRMNCRILDYNSYVFGLRVNFFEKNFFNFSYNYLDNKNNRDRSYHKMSLGVFFK